MWEHCNCNISFPYTQKHFSLSGNPRPPLYYGLILPCPFLHPSPFQSSAYASCVSLFPLAGIQSSTSDQCQIRLSLGLGSWLLPNRVCNRDGWMDGNHAIHGWVIWFLNSFQLLKGGSFIRRVYLTLI